MAIGEVLFLLWGIRVCYNVRNAESLYNEAKLISYAIYNIAFVNMLMVAIQWVYSSGSHNSVELQFKPETLCRMRDEFIRVKSSKISLSGWRQHPRCIYGNKFIDIPHVTSFLMPATYVVAYFARCRNDGDKRMKFKLDFESVKISWNPFFAFFFSTASSCFLKLVPI